MSTRVEIPARYVYSVIMQLPDNRRNTLQGPAKEWMKQNQIDVITGYNIVLHDTKWYIDFANRNDAIRFRLVMTEWPKPPPLYDFSAFYAPYVPIQTLNNAIVVATYGIQKLSRAFNSRYGTHLVVYEDDNEGS